MEAIQKIKDLIISITGETDEAIIDAHSESFMDICKSYASPPTTKQSAEELRHEIQQHLSNHKATQDWMSINKINYTMDVPMMVVAAMMDFESYASNANKGVPTEEEIELAAQNQAYHHLGLNKKTMCIWPIPENAPRNKSFYEGFKSCAKWMLDRLSNGTVKESEWISVEDRLPDGHFELRQNELHVLGYNEEWIHPDFNPLGIRICAYCKDWDNQWMSCEWVDSQDTYFIDEKSSPVKWQPLPSAPNQKK